MHVARYRLQPGRQELEERTTGKAVEDEARPATADFVCDEDFCARRSFGVGQLAVLALDQEPTQGNHEQDPE